MTELEANKKICPFISSDNPETDWTNCQASKCMAWKVTHPNVYTDRELIPNDINKQFKSSYELEEYINNRYGLKYISVPTKYSCLTHTTMVGIKQPYGEGFCTRIGDV